ncbi:MAG: hypothetical protein ACFB21_10440, partial [Opitutales bacterium]
MEYGFRKKSPAYQELRSHFTGVDREFIRDVLKLDGIGSEEVGEILSCFPCALLVLSDPRLRYGLLSQGPPRGLSAALYYGAQIMAAFSKAEVPHYDLAVALTLKLIHARNLKESNVGGNGSSEELTPLDLELWTSPAAGRTNFSLRARLPGVV